MTLFADQSLSLEAQCHEVSSFVLKLPQIGIDVGLRERPCSLLGQPAPGRDPNRLLTEPVSVAGERVFDHPTRSIG